MKRTQGVYPVFEDYVCHKSYTLPVVQVLKMMVGNNLKDTQLQQIVDKTILFADKDNDGRISFEEFCGLVGNTDVHKKMVVDV